MILIVQVKQESVHEPNMAEQGIAGALARALANRAQKIAPGMKHRTLLSQTIHSDNIITINNNKNSRKKHF